MTSPDREPEPRVPRPAKPFTWELNEEDRRELREPADELGDFYDPAPWLPGVPGRPSYVVVINQLSGYYPDQPRSLNEILESMASRARDPEPDWEAEP